MSVKAERRGMSEVYKSDHGTATETMSSWDNRGGQSRMRRVRTNFSGSRIRLGNGGPPSRLGCRVFSFDVDLGTSHYGSNQSLERG